MAIFFTDPNAPASAAGFVPIWRHYETSRFLYQAKIERLAPSLEKIRTGWPVLLAAPPGIFQIHAACEGDEIVSSVCGFRDTEETFVIQHAVSHGQPLRMIDCLQSMGASMSSSLVRFTSMFFRLENRWPTRLMQSVGERHPPGLMNLRTQQYLTCKPDIAAPRAEGVEDLNETHGNAVYSIGSAVLGPLRAAASGLYPTHFSLNILKQRYHQSGLNRDRRAFGVFRDRTLAGVALCHITPFPMNFSLLCGRVELLIHPDAPDRKRVVRDLCLAAIHDSAKRKEPLCPLLIDSGDVSAAEEAGFIDSGRQYSNFLWQREGERGFASTAIAFSHWYARVERLSRLETVTNEMTKTPGQPIPVTAP